MNASCFGQQQDWQWRGWNIRFTYQPTVAVTAAAPALLIHGFGASLGHWRHNIGPLSQTRSVYALDLLGFGGSDKPVVHYTIDLWVEQVYEFWQTHVKQPVILAGHSVGGIVSLTLAARHPEMVKGLCLISCADGPHPEELPHPFDWAVRALAETALGVLQFPLTYPLVFDWLRNTTVLRGWIKNVYKQDDAVDDELVEIFRRPAFDEGAEAVFIEALRAILTRRFDSPKNLLPGVRSPILVIWGQDDPAVPSFLADKFKQWQPDLSLIKLPGIGHCAHDELPQWVSALLSEWAASLEASSMAARSLGAPAIAS
ncbi:MAG: alpha/beta fold hydrolase [Cyanobacteria bacterium P01_D01_bin.123]